MFAYLHSWVTLELWDVVTNYNLENVVEERQNLIRNLKTDTQYNPYTKCECGQLTTKHW